MGRICDFFRFLGADFASNPYGSYDLVYIFLWLMLWGVAALLVMFVISRILGDVKRGK